MYGTQRQLEVRVRHVSFAECRVQKRQDMSTRVKSGPRRGSSGHLPAILAAGVKQRSEATIGVHPQEGVEPEPPRPPSPAELAGQLSAAMEQQKAERLAQQAAARQLEEQAKAARAEAKVARAAERDAAARAAAAAREARERQRLEKLAEAERKRLERDAIKEAKQAAAAQLAAEKAALRESKEAEKAARELAAQEAKEAKEAEKAAREARRVEEQREREARDALRRQQQDQLAAARAEEAAQRAEKRKAEADARAAQAEAKRARIRQEECEETLRQIHLLRDELETVGDRAQELLGKLISMNNCDADATDLRWMQALVDEAVAAQERLVTLIERSTIDWRTEHHARVIDEEEEDDDDDDEGSGEEESEDEEGVRVGKFGKLEVVADEDMGDEDGAEAFDQEAYRRAMAGLRKGRMLPSDLKGMEHD